MKALYEHLEGRKGNESFLAYRFEIPFFEFKWHYHAEYELTLITKGSGKRLVGDCSDNYGAGDLVLLGPDLPHTWSSNLIKNKTVGAVVVQFSRDFISRFLDFQEFKKISALLESSDRGLYFPDSKPLLHELELLPDRMGMEKVLALLRILQQLTTLNHKKLSSSYFQVIKGAETESRINRVCQFVQKHADENINLHTAATLIHLSHSAFSKFFKRATGKTFSDYVNDIRIGNACHMLTETDKAINEIAYETGFESLSYFNRVFLKKKGSTPRSFRSGIQSAY